MRVSSFSRLLLEHPVMTPCVAFSASSRTIALSRYQRRFFRQGSTTLSSVADNDNDSKQRSVLIEKDPIQIKGDEQHRRNQLLGGDFAGYTTRCDTRTGAATPVPVYLVPSSLLEWGQHPKALEVIVSEDHDVISTTEREQQQWNRVCLAVLPETGCGVDNLEVQKTTQEGWKVLLSQMDDKKNNNCISLVREVSPTSLMIETIFDVTNATTTMNDEQVEPHRLRVTVTVGNDEARSLVLLSIRDIVLSYERQFSTTSTKGTRANGGGLDGASVARWMGPNIAQHGVKILDAFPSSDDAEIVKQDDDGMNSSNNPTVLALPAGVTMESKTENTVAHLRVSHSSGQSVQYNWIMGDLASMEANSIVM